MCIIVVILGPQLVAILMEDIEGMLEVLLKEYTVVMLEVTTNHSFDVSKYNSHTS